LAFREHITHPVACGIWDSSSVYVLKKSVLFLPIPIGDVRMVLVKGWGPKPAKNVYIARARCMDGPDSPDAAKFPLHSHPDDLFLRSNAFLGLGDIKILMVRLPGSPVRTPLHDLRRHGNPGSGNVIGTLDEPHPVWQVRVGSSGT
jgi:hypothetical protein